jgi:HupE / UreJ protein
MKFILKIILTFGVFLLLMPQMCFAHNPTVSKMVIRMDSATQKWYAILSFDQIGIIASLENAYPELENNFKNDILWKEAFINYIKKHIKINSKNGNIKLGKGIVNLGSHFEAILELENLPKKIDYLGIENTCLLHVYPNQVNMVSVLIDKEIFDVILNKNEPKQTIYLSRSISNYFKSFYQFAKEGFRHVLPLGLDHILFILALFFLNSNLKSSVIQASMFTLAHSITLIITGLGYFFPNPNIIEPLIAISIFIMSVQNIFFKQINHSRLALTFLFGLIHGLGFANSFLSLQIPAKLSINALLAFNIGVELAQILIILGLYYFLAKWISKELWYQKYFVNTLSFSIGTYALLLTLQRL